METNWTDYCLLEVGSNVWSIWFSLDTEAQTCKNSRRISAVVLPHEVAHVSWGVARGEQASHIYSVKLEAKGQHRELTSLLYPFFFFRIWDVGHSIHVVTVILGSCERLWILVGNFPKGMSLSTFPTDNWLDFGVIRLNQGILLRVKCWFLISEHTTAHISFPACNRFTKWSSG